ncbi:DNA-binding domain-containing protein [Ostreiculturibacter nitratireducens]|uniref:HvfC/BufC N-terminal domain-containing protein n=1 Tax=Ostreiculturibacter nitratireducens TaxID=3075226 RepID=UPI0031B5DB72
MNQSAFTEALLDPDHAVPHGLQGPGGAPAGRRFAVYRNNVAVSLTEALRTAFPVVRKIVGEEFFDAMAGIYLRAHPPATPILMFYGAEMPAFLETFPPVAHLGYLPDVARLELALRRAYHAADAKALTAVDMLPERLLAARVVFAPAVTLLRSRWPLHAIWSANAEEGAPSPAMRAEDVLVTRPGFDPIPRLLPPGGGEAVARLQDGEPLGPALDAAGVDPAAIFAVLIGSGAIAEIKEEAP